MKRMILSAALLAGISLSWGFPAKAADDRKQVVEDLSEVKAAPGMEIILESGKVYKGTLVIDGVDSGKKPVIIRSSGTEPAVIDAAGEAEGILVRNSNGVIIRNISITADGNAGKTHAQDPATARGMRCGIRVDGTEAGHFGNILISGVKISDVYYENKGFTRPEKEVRSANGTQIYGWGIRVLLTSKEASVANVKIEKCEVSDVGHTGIKFTGKGGNLENIDVSYNKVIRAGGPGMQMGGVRNAHVHHNAVDHSGCPDDGRKWGRGSGFWCWSADDILLEHNSFMYANGPGDSAGAHIDYNCSNIVLQYNFSAYNAGGFVEVLGNCRNCAYRYNISVDDGWRIKGVNGFQEGKTLWLSGYIGSKERKGPYNTYIYNNTIYVSEKVASKVALENTLVNALVTNNIFCIKGKSSIVMGDQYRPEVAGESVMKNLVIDNNLFLHCEVLPASFRNTSMHVGDPRFLNPGGDTPESYIPTEEELVLLGKEVKPLDGDEIGLKAGLEVSKDFFGNRIRRPIMGAAVCR